MKQLHPLLYAQIARAAKIEGTFDPDLLMPHFEEDLTIDEARTVAAFLSWCHENGKAFGHGTYEERFAEWQASAGVAPAPEPVSLREMALEQLLLAYAKGEANGGRVQWEDLDLAVEYAKGALPGRYEAILREIETEDAS